MRTDDGFAVRPPRPDDLDALVALHSDPATNRYNPSGPLRGRAEGAAMLENWLDDWRRFHIGYWTILINPDEPDITDVVGFGGVRYLNAGRDRVFNLYYRFAPQHWGRGWASAVARRAADFARRVDPDTPVVARMQPDHGASRRVAEKAGLHLVGHDRDDRLVLADRPLPGSLLDALPAGDLRPGSSGGGS